MRSREEILIASMTAEVGRTNTWESLPDVAERLGDGAHRSLVKAEHVGGMLRAGEVTFEEAVSVCWGAP